LRFLPPFADAFAFVDFVFVLLLELEVDPRPLALAFRLEVDAAPVRFLLDVVGEATESASPSPSSS
jgi:hypothetical protein